MTASTTDAAAFLAGESSDVRRAVEVIGRLLAGSGALANAHSAVAFVEARLDQPFTTLVSERTSLSDPRSASVGAALGDLIVEHQAQVGPVEFDEPPTWRRIDLGTERLSVPHEASISFPAGTLDDAAVVVQLYPKDYGDNPYVMRVLARSGEQPAARRVLDLILQRARRDKSFYRGRVLAAGLNSAHQLTLRPAARPDVSRKDLVLPEAVWREVDANVAALTTRAELMRRLGLGTNRGVLLAGPPGVGKTALTRVIAAELAGEFTVILVDAVTAAAALGAVYRESADLRPAVVVLEDIDLYLGHRHAGGSSSLADFLAALDGTEKHPDVLTVASTNDPKALDAAATRASRFDSIVHLTAPDRQARALILADQLGELAPLVDAGVVAAALPEGVNGADIREVVRRAVIAHGEDVSTERLVAVVGAGRWKPAPLTGSYL